MERGVHEASISRAPLRDLRRTTVQSPLRMLPQHFLDKTQTSLIPRRGLRMRFGRPHGHARGVHTAAFPTNTIATRNEFSGSIRRVRSLLPERSVLAQPTPSAEDRFLALNARSQGQS